MQECGSGREACVQINRADDGLVGIGQEPLLLAASRFFFARAAPGITAKVQPPRAGVNRRRTNDAREALRELPRIPLREHPAQLFARNKAQDAVAQELEPFIVDAFGILAMRPVRQRAIQHFPILEMMAKQRFEFTALFRRHFEISGASHTGDIKRCPGSLFHYSLFTWALPPEQPLAS